MVPSMASLAIKSQAKACVLFINLSFLALLCFLFKAQFYSTNSFVSTHSQNFTRETQESCEELHKLKNYQDKCLFVKSQNLCDTNGYIDYLYLFYCICGKWPLLGYSLLFIWLLVLFYLLANTASVYFCSSLESLSKVLKLSPTIAGVTLLSLGNGAPDVFAIFVSFVGTGPRNVGVNSVLGGAFFVSCIVVGIISIVNSNSICIDKSDFVRDVCFLILGLSAILLMVIVGKVNVWGAVGFFSLYFIYVLIVYIMHVYWNVEDNRDAVKLNSSSYDDLSIPILHCYKKEATITVESDVLEVEDCFEGRRSYCRRFLSCLELPLYLPRRLTIPVVCEERWSKPFAVASVVLAPVLLAVLCDSDGFNFNTRLVIYIVGGFIGVLFGTLAFVTTETSNPPKKFVFPWLVGGFVMSVTWSYITANELVALLVSIGHILGISSSILGLTVLAWGNSLGDLITNVAMAVNGGPEGTQVAISGCYAGPIFNILVGLGLSLVFSSWYEYPVSFVIPRDPLLLEILGFLALGLLWALVVLPLRNMKPDRFFGVGLLVIYLGSISFRVFQTVHAL